MDLEIKVPIWLFETLSLIMKLEGFLWGFKEVQGVQKHGEKHMCALLHSIPEELYVYTLKYEL